MQQRYNKSMERQNMLMQQLAYQQQMLNTFMSQTTVTPPPPPPPAPGSCPPIFNWPAPNPGFLALLQSLGIHSPLTPQLTVNNMGVIQSLTSQMMTQFPGQFPVQSSGGGEGEGNGNEQG